MARFFIVKLAVLVAGLNSEPLFQSFFFRSNWSPIATGLNLEAWNDCSPSLTLQTTHLIFFNDIKT
jgi:hypothetical protein